MAGPARVTPGPDSGSVPRRQTGMDLTPSGQRTQVMRGRLSDYSLADLLQFLASLRKTGHLVIERSNPPASAGIYVADGAVVHAYCPAEEGAAAIHALLRWDEGRFVFLAGVKPERTSVVDEVGHLLLEGMRQKDEYHDCLRRLPAADTVLHRMRDRSAMGDLLLTVDEWRALGRLDGRRTVAQLLLADPDGEVLAAQRLAALVDRGLALLQEPHEHLVVVLAKDAAPGPAAILPAPPAALLARLDGRSSLAQLQPLVGLNANDLAESARFLVEVRLARVISGRDWWVRSMA